MHKKKFVGNVGHQATYSLPNISQSKIDCFPINCYNIFFFFQIFIPTTAQKIIKNGGFFNFLEKTPLLVLNIKKPDLGTFFRICINHIFLGCKTKKIIF
jgi:hypothetical protein